ncbi:MAG: LysM peptidoglycan-binding domain-containing protein [Betaproteobacteria bacterium]
MPEYIVQKGDTLSSIARKNLNDVNRWQEIARLNSLHNSNLIFVGQKLRLPDVFKGLRGGYVIPNAMYTSDSTLSADIALARGYLFVIFEYLPEVGIKKVIRKVAAVPKDFSLLPAEPSGSLSIAEHALNISPQKSQFLSASIRAFGAPSIGGKSLILDVGKIQGAGGRIYWPNEVIADLERFVRENPKAGKSIERLISTIKNIEGEVLISGGTPESAVSHPSSAHQNYIRSAENLWAEFRAGKMSRTQVEQELASLEKTYSKARIVGNVGRVLTVFGVVITVAELADASRQSLEQRSFRPLGAEALRQAGGWGGALAGAKIGLATGALFGVATGPGAIVTGALGAIVFGAVGYFSADWLADHVSAN